MKSQTVLSKILVLIFATLIVNQMACNNASFESAEETKGQTAPAPDNPDDLFGESDSGDAVRCDNSSDPFCDRGDDGLVDDVPDLNYTPPKCSVTKLSAKCYMNTCGDTRRKPIDAVDLWLVVDSSRSFDSERVAVAKSLTNSRGLIAGMIRDGVAVRVSVIAGHAPSGPYNGVRSAAPATASSPYYAQVTIRSTSEFSSKRAQLLNILDENMRESPISVAKRNRGRIEYLKGLYKTWPLVGPHSGSDELGLRNFKDAMKRTTIPSNHGWIVLFMSDENDACTPFVQGGRYVYSHPTDEAEMKAWYCNNVTTSNVYAEAVRYAGARPFALGALVYTNQAPIPSYAHPQASLGRGYTQVVAKAGREGVIVDLASQDFLGLETTADRVVNELVKITNESVGNHTQYPIYTSSSKRISLKQVAINNGHFNMQVWVDGRRTNYTIDSKNSLVRPSRVGDAVEIRFCVK